MLARRFYGVFESIEYIRHGGNNLEKIGNVSPDEVSRFVPIQTVQTRPNRLPQLEQDLASIMRELSRLVRETGSRELRYAFRLLQVQCDSSLAAIRQFWVSRACLSPPATDQAFTRSQGERLLRGKPPMRSLYFTNEPSVGGRPVSGHLDTPTKRKGLHPRRDFLRRNTARDADSSTRRARHSDSLGRSEPRRGDISLNHEQLLPDSSPLDQNSDASGERHSEASSLPSGASSKESSFLSSLSSLGSGTFQSTLSKSSFAPPTFLTDIDSRPSHRLSMASSLASDISSFNSACPQGSGHVPL